MQDIERAKRRLSGEVTLVLARGDEIYERVERGVRPLLELFDTGKDFTDFSAADRVVGRGAAFIYKGMRIRALYARTVSEAAREILEQAGIAVEYDECVSRILNRTKDGFCPIESCVMDITDTPAAVAAIRKRLLSLK